MQTTNSMEEVLLGIEQLSTSQGGKDIADWARRGLKRPEITISESQAQMARAFVNYRDGKNLDHEARMLAGMQLAMFLNSLV